VVPARPKVGAFESGLLTRIARRAVALLDEAQV
jgi:hypothetical protein